MVTGRWKRLSDTYERYFTRSDVTFSFIIKSLLLPFRVVRGNSSRHLFPDILNFHAVYFTYGFFYGGAADLCNLESRAAVSHIIAL
jgi:hypothetical protein